MRGKVPIEQPPWNTTSTRPICKHLSYLKLTYNKNISGSKVIVTASSVFKDHANFLRILVTYDFNTGWHGTEWCVSSAYGSIEAFSSFKNNEIVYKRLRNAFFSEIHSKFNKKNKLKTQSANMHHFLYFLSFLMLICCWFSKVCRFYGLKSRLRALINQ